jgi:hypothetical protein
MKSRISENGVSFFGAGGHNHDGVNSSLINTSSYSLFDFSPNYVGAQSRISRQQGNRTAMEDFIVRVVNSQVLSPAGITLEPNTLNGKTITANTITATQIAANTITANNIVVGTITGAQIANGAIGNSQVNNVMSIINLQSNFVTTNATIQSTVYTAGAGGVGWAINAAGNAEFNNVTVRGTVVSGAGSIGGWTINTSSLTSGSTALYSNGQATFGNTTLFSNGRITNGSLIISATGALDATGAVIRGTIEAGSGLIAGININGNRLFSGVGNWNNPNTPFYLDINGYFSLEDKLSWNPDSNVLSVKGDITGSSGTFSGSLSGASISGGTISGTSLSGSTVTVGSFDGVNSGLQIRSDGFIQGSGGGVRIMSWSGATGTALFGETILTPKITADVIEITSRFDARNIGVTISPLDNNRPLDLQRNYAENAHFIRFWKTSGTPGESGKIRFSGTTGLVVAYDTASDARLKTDITKIKNAINTIKMVEPVEYRFIEDSEGTFDGFIAQDLYKVYDKPVYVGGESPHKDPWSIDYSKMVPIITAALKESIDKIEELEQRVKSIEGV